MEPARDPLAELDHAATPVPRQSLGIVGTRHASARDRDLCLDTGMNEYLTKPFDPQRVFRVLAA